MRPKTIFLPIKIEKYRWKTSFCVAFVHLSLSLSLSHFSLSRPVFIQASVLESIMTNISRAAFLQARKLWPDRGHEACIPTAAKQIYEFTTHGFWRRLTSTESLWMPRWPAGSRASRVVTMRGPGVPGSHAVRLAPSYRLCSLEPPHVGAG